MHVFVWSTLKKELLNFNHLTIDLTQKTGG